MSFASVPSRTNSFWFRTIITLGLILLATAILIFPLSRVLFRSLNHDEHQFVAAGVLFAKTNLLPYRDYAYFHVPLQPIIYGWLFRFTSEYLLTARLVSAVAGWSLHITIFGVAWHYFRAFPLGRRFISTATISLLVLFAPIVIYTSGTAWNHEVPTLLTLWAFLLQLRIVKKSNVWYALLMGILIGLATATRLTFILMLPAGVIGFWVFSQSPIRTKLLLSIALIGGAIIGALPAIWFLVQSPEAFIFGTVEYAQLNTRFRQQTGFTASMDLGSKLSNLATEVMFNTYGPPLALVAVVLSIGYRFRNSVKSFITPHPQNISLFYLPFLFIGSLAPTPTWLQYFYSLVPFVVLTILYGLPQQWQSSRLQHYLFSALFLIAGLTTLLEVWRYEDLGDLFLPRKWTISTVRSIGNEIRALGKEGAVLTIAPVLALEGDMEIYPFYVNGPFSVRAANLVSATDRDKYKLVGNEELVAQLEGHAPRTIVLGYDKDDAGEESALLNYAVSHPYSLVVAENEVKIYFSAIAQWADSIRLAAYRLPETPIPAGDTFQAVFYVEKIAAIEKDLNVLVRLIGHDGVEIARHEGYPWGIPTSTWVEEQVLPDGHEITIPSGTLPGYYRVEISFYDPTTFESLPIIDPWTQTSLGTNYSAGYIEVTGLPTTPQTPLTPPAQFTEPISLAGMAMEGPLQANETLSITLFWEATGIPSRPYTSFIHLVDKTSGQLVAQVDQPPLDGFIPMSFWREGDTWVDSIPLTLPDSLREGEYEIRVGLYDPTSGQRLQIHEGIGAGQDYVTITTFTLPGE